MKKKIGRAKHKRLSRSTGGNITLMLFLGVISIFMALPLVYIVANAFKPLSEIFIFPPRFFVLDPTTKNFTMLYKIAQENWVPLSRYVFNSLFVSIVGTFTYIVIACMAAYPLAKHKFRGQAILSAMVVGAILFRPEVTAIPQYIVIAQLGLVDTYASVILPALSGTFGVFLVKQFMVTIPDAVLESARIDGANEIRTMYSIVMPSIKPAWLTLIIFTFQSLWSSTGGYIYTENLKMLPSMLSQVVAGGIARVGAGSAVALVLMIPPMVIFIVSQSSVVETMAHSGIKD